MASSMLARLAGADVDVRDTALLERCCGRARAASTSDVHQQGDEVAQLIGLQREMNFPRAPAA